MTVEPRFHTPRNPNNRTLGGKMAKTAALLGKPLMPWQRRAADVALEIDENGDFVYHTVLITVPRQSGKTMVTLAAGFHRLLTTPDGKIWYTAQSGQSARERFLSELVTDVQKKLPGICKLKRGAGDTRLIFPPIGSQFRPHPPTDKYLHGEQSDLNLIDEPWAYTELQGEALMQAIVPTQNTRHNAQTWFLSTMGDAGSTWWHSRIDKARAAPGPRTCLIDYGLDESLDGTDVEAVIKAHPAVGHTIKAQAIRDAHDSMKPAEFARAYANQRTQTTVSIFTGEQIARVMDDNAAATGPVAFGVAVSWDRDRAAIVAAGLSDDERPVLEVVESRPGTSWVAVRLKELQEHNPLSIVVDARSPAAPIATNPALEEILTIPDSRAVAAATSQFLDGIGSGSIRWRTDRTAAAEFDALALRTVGDLGQMLDRRHSAGSICHLEAAMLALCGLQQTPPPAPAPMIWTGTNA